MTVHIGPKSAADPAGPVALRTILAVELAGLPAHRGLWRSRRASAVAMPSVAGLADGGHASPMGFWLADASGADPAPSEARPIALQAPGGPSTTAPVGPSPARRGGRPSQTVRVKASPPGPSDLALTIGPEAAWVVASEAAWPAIAEPVLLAACQYWRFCALDEALDRLTERAEADLRAAVLPGWSALRDGRRLTATAMEVQALLLDLPHFGGPLTDPLAYLSSERSARIYEPLAEDLRLGPWCEAIDERAEAVADIYEAVAAKLAEYRNFAWETALVGLIVLILLADLAIALRSSFGP